MEKNEVAKAFVAAQAAFKAAKKDSINPHFRSSYADLSSVIEAVSEALSKNKLAFSQPVDFLEGNYVISTVLVHESGQEMRLGSMRVPIPATEITNSQKVGSAITYARRYHLSSAMGLAQEDDDGNSVSLPPQSRASAGPSRPAPTVAIGNDVRPTDKQVALIRDLSSKAGVPFKAPAHMKEASQMIDMLNTRLRSKSGGGNKHYGDDAPPPDEKDHRQYTTQDIPF